MNQAETRTIVRQVLRDHGRLIKDIDSLSDDDDLYAAGMASFASVNVMIALEDGFDVEFPEAMLQRQVFQSVESIVSALETITTSV